MGAVENAASDAIAASNAGNHVPIIVLAIAVTLGVLLWVADKVWYHGNRIRAAKNESADPGFKSPAAINANLVRMDKHIKDLSGSASRLAAIQEKSLETHKINGERILSIAKNQDALTTKIYEIEKQLAVNEELLRGAVKELGR